MCTLNESFQQPSSVQCSLNALEHSIAVECSIALE
jgi:hypothetical protein